MASGAYSSLRHRDPHAIDPNPVVVRRVVLSLPEGQSINNRTVARSPTVQMHVRPVPARPAPAAQRAHGARAREPHRTETLVELVGPLDDVTAFLDGLVDPLRAKIVDEEALPAPGQRNDLVYPDPGPLRRLGVPWDPLGSAHAPSSELSTEDIVVAIIDSGVMSTHPALRDHFVVPGKTVLRDDEDEDTEDEDGHGTLLAGTILSATNHDSRVKLKSVKFIDGRTRPHADNAAKAIVMALNRVPLPAIINLSWDLGVETIALREAIKTAESRGVLVVVAAGNDGANNDKYPTFPACYGHEGCTALDRVFFSNVVAVMATNPDDSKAGFSNYGAASVHLAAPGVRIVSTHQYLAATPSPGGGSLYQRYDGTSAAAAYVSGAAAFLKSRNPKLAPEGLKKLLGRTSDYRVDLRCRAMGRVNVGEAFDRRLDPAWLVWESRPDEMLSEQAPKPGIPKRVALHERPHAEPGL